MRRSSIVKKPIRKASKPREREVISFFFPSFSPVYRFPKKSFLGSTKTEKQPFEAMPKFL